METNPQRASSQVLAFQGLRNLMAQRKKIFKNVTCYNRIFFISSALVETKLSK